MSDTTYESVLIHHVCGNCGVHFGMDEGFKNARLKDKRSWFCPNGCSRVFTSKTEAEKLQEELDQTKARLANSREQVEFQRQQKEKEERRVRAYRGVVGRFRKRVGNGVCPCCNRTFRQLSQHMAKKHPKYGEDKS